MKKNLLPKIIILSFLLLSLFQFTSQTKAADDTGLRISPPIIEATLQKGETYQEIIKIENLGSTTETYYPQVMSFIAKGEEGAQEFLEPEEGNKTYSLAEWINISKEPITLASQEKKAISFNIVVPENAEAGGKYGVIFFQTQISENTDNKSDIGISSKTGSIILARIAGPTTERGAITEFSIDKNLYQYLPANFVTRFRNTGDVHLKPVGKIEITNIFGKKVADLIVNEKLGNVLPQSIRRFENTWNRDSLTIGKYKATIYLSYGENTTYYTSNSLSFWVLPFKEIGLIIGGIILSVIMLIILIKSYNRTIVKKALKQEKKEEDKENTKEKTE